MGADIQICSMVPCSKNESLYETNKLTKCLKSTNRKGTSTKFIKTTTNVNKKYIKTVIYLQRKIRNFLQKLRIGKESGKDLSIICRVMFIL